MKLPSKFLFCFSIFFCTFFVENLSAKQKIASAFVNGREVHLLSDFTWVYVTKQQMKGDCIYGNQWIKFCGSSVVWHRLPSKNPAIDAGYRYDDKHTAIMFVEEIGKNDGLTLEGLSKQLLASFESEFNKTVQGLEVLDVQKITIDGQSFDRLIYTFKQNGLNHTVTGAFHVADDVNYKIYTIAKGADEYKGYHDFMTTKFYSGVKILQQEAK